MSDETVQEQGNGADQLTETEVRVLAVLAEKEALTPDAYPMSLNALVNGCNQLSSRDPVMALNESDVVVALDRLIARRLASEVRQASARVVKYEHRMRIMWTLEQDKLAALVLLMLRGPQTAGEVRGRAGRLHEFTTAADAEAALQFLIDKYPALVARLPVAPGAKEARYVHLLSGEAPAEAPAMRSESPRQERIAALESEVAALRAELEALREEMQRFRAQFE